MNIRMFRLKNGVATLVLKTKKAALRISFGVNPFIKDGKSMLFKGLMLKSTNGYERMIGWWTP